PHPSEDPTLPIPPAVCGRSQRARNPHLSDNTPDSGDTAEKRVRKPRVTKAAKAAKTEEAAAPTPPPAAPASAPEPAAPPAASSEPQASPQPQAQQHDAGEQRQQGGNGSHGNNPGNRQGNNRRDRFRNRRDRNRGRDDGLPRDDNAPDQGQRLPPPSIPEGFPQYSLGDLKRMPAQKLLDIADQLGISESVARARKQDVIFALLKVLTRTSEGVQADGVLEILPDGFGFLRAAEASYLAGPDDTYISPSQIRRFNLRTGDHLSGR